METIARSHCNWTEEGHYVDHGTTIPSRAVVFGIYSGIRKGGSGGVGEYILYSYKSIFDTNVLFRIECFCGQINST